MARVSTIEKDEAPREVQQVYDRVEQVFGLVPNLLKTVAHVPAAVRPLTELLGVARSAGSVDARTKELAILRASLQNGCHY